MLELSHSIGLSGPSQNSTSHRSLSPAANTVLYMWPSASHAETRWLRTLKSDLGGKLSPGAFSRECARHETHVSKRNSRKLPQTTVQDNRQAAGATDPNQRMMPGQSRDKYTSASGSSGVGLLSILQVPAVLARYQWFRSCDRLARCWNTCQGERSLLRSRLYAVACSFSTIGCFQMTARPVVQCT